MYCFTRFQPFILLQGDMTDHSRKMIFLCGNNCCILSEVIRIVLTKVYYVRWSESSIYVVLTKVYYVRRLYTAFNPVSVVLTCGILHKEILKICIKSSVNVVLSMTKVRWSNPAWNPLNYGMFSNFIISCIESSVNVVLTNIYYVRWSYPALNPLNNWYSTWCTKEDDYFLHLILYLCSTHNGI